MNNLLWDLFTILCQGSIAGLVVLFFTLKYQKNQEYQKMRSQALLLLCEIENHLIIYEGIIDGKPSEEIRGTFESREWEAIKYTITIDHGHLKELMTHYYWIETMKDHFINELESWYPPTDDKKEHLVNCYNRGAAIHSLLKSIIYPKKKSKYLARYNDRIKSCTDQTFPLIDN